MNMPPELHVTLSRALLRRLTAESIRLDVPLEYLIASLVCDTMDTAQNEAARSSTVDNTQPAAA